MTHPRVRPSLTPDYYVRRLQTVDAEVSLFAQAVIEKPSPSHADSWAALTRYRGWLQMKKIALEKLVTSG